ncbi:MAG: hypothetical protein ACRERX_21965 [Pseudomonas sp.]
MRSERNRYHLAVALAAAATLTACQDSTGPEPYRWAGTYATAEKFGGTTGTWRSMADIIITSDRNVVAGGRQIVNPDVDESTISWSRADGNATNANFTLMEQSSDAYFWGTTVAAGKLFQGWIQYAGQGRLDYRGLAR